MPKDGSHIGAAIITNVRYVTTRWDLDVHPSGSNAAMANISYLESHVVAPLVDGPTAAASGQVAG